MLDNLDKIELLNSIVTTAPEGAILEVYGFYSENISAESFESIFGKDSASIRNKKEKFLIPLDNESKKNLIEILHSEKSNLICDLVHFAIKYNNELVATANDNMELVRLKSRIYPSIKKEVVGVDVKLLESIYDPFFNS